MSSPENTSDLLITEYVQFVIRMLTENGVDEEAVNFLQQTLEVAAIGFKMVRDLKSITELYYPGLNFDSG